MGSADEDLGPRGQASDLRAKLGPERLSGLKLLVSMNRRAEIQRGFYG